MIEQRQAAGKNYGVVLLPDGLLTRIPEMRQLLQEIKHVERSHKLLSSTWKRCSENFLNDARMDRRDLRYLTCPNFGI